MLSAVPVSPTTYPVYAPEDCPFETVFVDVTHRCNMKCRNCYIPNRAVPDLDAAWLERIFARLPRGRYLRLAGAEPTMRPDLPALIRSVRSHGHHPLVLTNGLKIADRAYLRELKRAGVAIVYLSLNGAFDDDLYERIDSLRCAGMKTQAFENLRAEHMFTSIGMILVRGVNEGAVTPLLQAIRSARNVRELKLRSIGAIGRHMDQPPLKLAELLEVFCAAAGISPATVDRRAATPYAHDFRFDRLRVQLTQWPDLNNPTRGRLTPEGLIAPMFEHVMEHEGGY